MSFDFFVVGIILIWCLFYIKLNNTLNWLFLGGISLIVISYFNSNLFIDAFNISIDVFVLIATVLIILHLLTHYKDIDFKRGVENISYVLLLYICLNLITIECNSFFNTLPLIVTIVFINGFNGGNLFTCLFGVNVSLVVSEIFNLVFMVSKMEFSAIFCHEFVICIVVCNVFVGAFFKLIEILKRKKHEKNC